MYERPFFGLTDIKTISGLGLSLNPECLAITTPEGREFKKGQIKYR